MPGRVTRSRNSLNGSNIDTAPKRSDSGPTAATGKKRKTSSTESNKKGKHAQDPAPRASKKIKSEKAKPDLGEVAKLAAKIGANTSISTGQESPQKSPQKLNSYNLTPGTSPYPSYPRPTAEECQHVKNILAEVHGDVSAPKTIPAPNLESSGCGEVPSVLDALIRTRLSAATNNANSSRAFRGLVEKFGIIKEGVGKGSVNWDKVRLAPVKDVFEAIKTGGLADVKSRDIQKILNMVYEETIEREAADGKKSNSKAHQTVLSLDHLHSMGSEEAFDKLIGYPGVGPKTASCVLLFCMQRPSFAVDTHVFRIVSWLGWVPSDSAVRRMAKEANTGKSSKTKPPPPASRNTAYAHLDVLIPDDLKYPLHYLFIRHGKTCPSCAAKKDSKIAREWGDKKCPLAPLKGGRSGDTGKIKGESTTENMKDEQLSETESDADVKLED